MTDIAVNSMTRRPTMAADAAKDPEPEPGSPPPSVGVRGDRTPADDVVLVHRARGGDTAAFGRLVRRYESRVLALARRTLGRGGAAATEDVAQETFLRAWRALGRFDAGRPVAPWLLTITIRVARSHGRRERRRAMLPWSRPAAPPVPLPASPIVASDCARSLWGTVDRVLSPRARAALWLAYGERLPGPAIAVILGTSDTAVRAMLSRARRTLRDHLDEEMLHDR